MKSIRKYLLFKKIIYKNGPKTGAVAESSACFIIGSSYRFKTLLRAHEMKFLMFFHANNTHNDCIRCVFSILTKLGIITVLTVKTLEDCEKWRKCWLNPYLKALRWNIQLMFVYLNSDIINDNIFAKTITRLINLIWFLKL